MIRTGPGVFLDVGEVAYVAAALEEFARSMAERRDEHGNPIPTQPTARLADTTAKLRRYGGSVDPLAVDDPAAKQRQRPEPPADRQSVRALQRNSMNAGPHDLGTGDAARRLGLTPNAVRDLARRGRLRATRSRNGTRWRYDAAAVAAYAERRPDQRR